VSTATPSATSGRLGTVYDPTTLAAAVPIHYHPYTNTSLGGQDFLMLANQIWSPATVSSGHPGQYSAFTPVNTPSWVMVNAASGTKSLINGSVGIPMKTPVSSATLTAAVSRGNDQLWTLNSTSAGAVVQHWHVNTAVNTVTPLAEETIPTGSHGGESVLFDDGLHWSASTAPYTHAYGTGSSTGAIYSARKAWSQVGHVALPATVARPQTTQWEVWTGSGWDPDFTKASPLTSQGVPITSAAPLSFGHYGNTGIGGASLRPKTTGYTFMSTVTKTGSSYAAQLYSSLGGRDWAPYLAPIALGASGSTYTGANIQLQPQIGPNASLISSTSATAIPYVYTTKTTTGGNSSLNNIWGLIQVPALS
jgi:hypothetical protein